MDLLSHPIRPDCHCPRSFMNSFNLIKANETEAAASDSLCSNTEGSTAPRYTNQYQGPLAIFTPQGWVSDYAQAVNITIKMPQTMLVRKVDLPQFISNLLAVK